MLSVSSILLALCVLACTAREVVHAAVPHETQGEVHVDTSKALFFREIDGEVVASSRVRRHGEETVVDVEKRDSFVKTSSMTGGGRAARSSGVEDVHVRTKRSTDFTSADADAIVAKHNEGRSMVTPEAADMKTMEWDATLATMAQEWSDGCHYEHGNPTNISPFSAVGQNLYIKWGLRAPGTPPDGTAATQAWYNEYEYYNFDDLSCQSGQQCGHYTQNVWASTYAVGCGLTFCTTATDDDGNQYNGAWLITCNYGPAGNYVGAKPYTAGPSCTKCDSGSGLCYDNLCSDCSTSDANCDCRADCQNCASLNSDCTCSCRDGWYGSDCATLCEDTHENCGANPGWPLSWCNSDRQYVLDGCPLMCSICNAADPNFVCNSNLLNQNGLRVLLYEDITQWNSIQAGVLSSFRTSVINYCTTRQSTCCPAANGTTVKFADVGLTLSEDYPVETLDYAQAAYWIQVVGLSPVAPGECATDDGGFLSHTVISSAINQDLASLESSLNIDIVELTESGAERILLSFQTILLVVCVYLLNL